ncbi:MAG: hypothetical protein M3Y41_12220 [Pseudomonadota bacterium]|nr:hypothetical protein [Pseudomonadota bacterium]
MQTTSSLPATARPLWIPRLGRNRLVIGVAAIGVIAAAAGHWSWLVAIGAAPLLLSVAPCAAMCGLGLCMHRMGGRARSLATKSGQTVRETPEASSATQET